MTKPTFLLLTCASLLLSSRPSRADEAREEPPTISVSGTGKVSAVPDVADITVGVRTQAETAQKALAANSEAMNTLHATLKERGVAAKDIQTTQIQVSPQYSQPIMRGPGAQTEFVPRVIGYRVDNHVQITARKVDKLGTLLDALVQAGANQVYGISFRVDQGEKLLGEARKRAVADAKRKADTLAGEAGVVVGLPLKIQEDAAPIHPPYPMRAMMMEGAAAAPTPIAAGEQELSVNVHVVYRLKEAK